MTRALGINGVLMSKMDGDAWRRRGAFGQGGHGKLIKPLSVQGKSSAILSRSIPTAWPPRIPGMGDVLTLIEKAQQTFDQKQAAETAKKMASGKLTLTDFLGQLQQMKKHGLDGGNARHAAGRGREGPCRAQR